MGGGSTVGTWLVEDERLAMITFTGSPSVGQFIKSRCGMKRTTLELGANSAVIVDRDADLDFAVSRCAMGSYANSGQVCISVQRIYVHRDVYAEFERRFAAATEAQVVGDPLDPACDVGPMIEEGEAVRTEGWIREAVEQGARILTGGKRNGAVFEPTVLVDVKPEMKVMCQEIFAPVVSLVPFSEFSEAVRLADDSVYGLQAGVFTRDIGHAFEAIRGIDVGGVIVNDVPTYRADHMPYGGNRLSGLGREGVKYAMEEMTNVKMVCFRL
jgi:acyl-CoA reductase-like NAD-dependent aldehyde dehydrogenase